MSTSVNTMCRFRPLSTSPHRVIAPAVFGVKLFPVYGCLECAIHPPALGCAVTSRPSVSKVTENPYPFFFRGVVRVCVWCGGALACAVPLRPYTYIALCRWFFPPFEKTFSTFFRWACAVWLCAWRCVLLRSLIKHSAVDFFRTILIFF